MPQIVSIVAVVVWALVTAFARFYRLKFTMGVRVSEAEEMQGLDISEHGIQTYPELPLPASAPKYDFSSPH